jgi:hypothetical protein
VPLLCLLSFRLKKTRNQLKKLKAEKELFVRINQYFIGKSARGEVWIEEEINLKNEQKLGLQKSILYIYTSLNQKKLLITFIL